MKADLLANIPLFSKLDVRELEALGSLLQSQPMPANEPVFWIGDHGDDLFIVQSGRVKISYPDELGKEITLNVLGPGAFFGDLSLLDGGVRSASVRTVDATELLKLSRSDFLHFLHHHPTAAVEVLMVLGNRQRDMIDKLRTVANANLEIEQLATTWQKIADTIAKVSASQVFVLMHVGWFSIWILTNMLLGQRGWDPFPFGLLTLCVSLEAIFLSIFVLISQNRAGEKDRIRSDADYQVNLKAQHEIMQLHTKLDRLTETLRNTQRLQ